MSQHIFAKVDEADRKELEAFAKFQTRVAKEAEGLTDVIDCVWVRRWKQIKQEMENRVASKKPLVRQRLLGQTTF